MALLTKFLKKKHSFHRITAPTHILGTRLLLLRQKLTQPSTFDHRTHTLIWTDRTLRLYCSINEISRKLPFFSPHHCPHTHSMDSSPVIKAQRTQPSLFDCRTHPLNGLKLAQLSNFLTHHICSIGNDPVLRPSEPFPFSSPFLW